MIREKLLATVAVRIGLDLLDEIDAYQRMAQRERGVPLSRSIVIREIVELGMIEIRARVEAAKAADGDSRARASDRPRVANG